MSDSVNPMSWITAHEATLSIGFFRQECCNGLPFPPPGDLPNPGIEPRSHMSPELQVDSLPTEPRAVLEDKDIGAKSAVGTDL